MSFYVMIIDGNGEEIKVKVTFEVFEIFEEERKAVERLRKEKERHIVDKDINMEVST